MNFENPSRSDVMRLLGYDDKGAPPPVNPTSLIVNCDGSGGFKDGRHRAGYGYFVRTINNYPVVWDWGLVPEDEGSTTNCGEYWAVIQALRDLYTCGMHQKPVLLCSDSQLVIYQILGDYAVNKEHLRTLHAKAQEARSHFHTLLIQWIPREMNVLADMMSVRAFPNHTRGEGG